MNCKTFELWKWISHLIKNLRFYFYDRTFSKIFLELSSPTSYRSSWKVYTSELYFWQLLADKIHRVAHFQHKKWLKKNGNRKIVKSLSFLYFISFAFNSFTLINLWIVSLFITCIHINKWYLMIENRFVLLFSLVCCLWILQGHTGPYGALLDHTGPYWTKQNQRD